MIVYELRKEVEGELNLDFFERERESRMLAKALGEGNVANLACPLPGLRSALLRPVTTTNAITHPSELPQLREVHV